MIQRIPLPSQSYLRECFDYMPETGIVKWRERPLRHFLTERNWKQQNSRSAGKRVGTAHSSGYLLVKIDQTIFYLHRVIWKWMTGEDPDPDIDHKNLIKRDNRWVNFRLATQQQNSRNRTLFRDKKSGLPKGVQASRDRFRATIGIGTSSKRLGTFATAEEAHTAYMLAAQQYHGEFANGGPTT